MQQITRMVLIPDTLHCLFSTEIEQHDGSFVLEVPGEEIETGDITPGATYRVAIVPVSPSTDEQSGQGSQSRKQEDLQTTPSQRPPVQEGDQRTVTIETTGDQGDGIARVERGYVVIVPGSVPGDELTVEIQLAKENFAMAEIVDGDDLTYE